MKKAATKIARSAVQFTTLRCSRCDWRFALLDMDRLTEFKCPKCKARHIKVRGPRDRTAQWYDEKVLELWK